MSSDQDYPEHNNLDQVEHDNLDQIIRINFDQAPSAIDPPSSRVRHQFVKNPEADEPEGSRVTRPINLGRNRECQCGSGRKFKRCHGREIGRVK